MNTPSRIDSFTGAYRFLSNFYPAKVTLGCLEYPTVEHAYQAAKAIDLKDAACIRLATSPGDARHIGRSIPVRGDWEQVKVGIMEELLRQKFSDPINAEALLSTGDVVLIEDNNWGDRFWGQVRGEGDNRLGVLLMMLRAELRSSGNLAKEPF